MSKSNRPLMTLALMTWNHERFIKAAFRAALAQDYSPLEILVSDDASKDNTWAMVEHIAATYHGPHQLRLNRNMRNLGPGAHADLVMSMARGIFIVLSAGDDVDEPNRVSAIATAATGNATAVAAPLKQIDAEGNQLKELFPVPQPPITPESLALSGKAIAGGSFAKAVYNVFGNMGESVVTAEDIVLSFRAALVGSITVLDEPLMNYRRHGSSLLGSSGSQANDLKAYRAGLRRMLQGIVAARRIQLSDLDKARTLGLVDAERYAKLAGILQRHLALDGLHLDFILKQPGSVSRLFNEIRSRRISFKDAVKMMLASYVGGPWYRYQGWRSRRIGRSVEL
jgi:hypothetical protein